MLTQFSDKELIQIGIALVAGGAMGTILKAILDAYQKRIQTITYHVMVVEKSRISEELGRLEAKFNIAGEDEVRRFERYYITKIVFTNSTNTHFDEFNFGLTLWGEDVAFQVDSISPDRHHSLEQQSRLRWRMQRTK